MLAHNVYFTLEDGSDAAVEAHLASARKHLASHPGIVFFACGRVSDLSRPVNVRDFHVGLHIVFESREAHDAYQEAASHKTFIEENRESWEKVRVFDTEW